MDVVLGGREVQHEVVILGEEVAPADFYGLPDQDVDVGGLEVVGHLAACDPREVQQVLNESGL